MPGSKAATVFGNRGGGWAPTETTARAWRSDVPCSGGPHDGMTLAIWSQGAKASPLPPEIPYPDTSGRYVLEAGGYRWVP